MRKTYKSIISLCAVLIFALSLIPVPAHALGDPFTAIAVGGISGISGAGLFGSMASASGFNVGFSSGTTVDECDALWNSLNPDHVYFDGNKGQETVIDPITEIPTVYDYISVDISDWLTAQNDFIKKFVTDYSVTDNSSAQISSYKVYNNYAFNKYHNKYYGSFVGTIGVGNTYNVSDLHITFSQYNQYIKAEAFINNVSQGSVNLNSSTNGKYVCLYLDGTSIYWGYQDSGNIYSIIFSGRRNPDTRSASWTSGTVNTGVFDGYSRAKVKIPASSWSPSDPTNWNVAEFLEELTVKLVSAQASDIIIEDDSGPVPPTPVPVPSTPLGDIPTDEWYDLFGLPVLEGQEEIHNDLQDFSSSVSDGLDDVVGELEDIESDVESIDTNIGIGNGLLGDLKSIGQSIQSTLSSILSGVTDLVQEIVLSTETFIAGIINSIMGGLGGWLSTMRNAFSIWHYVVEWVGSISTVFSWFWSVAGNTSYYIQLPIYASLAGAVVLAFYKRFGK